jgi:hypothetical protein
MNLSCHAQKKTDMVLCRIYKKAVTKKSMEERAKPIDVGKEEPGVSSDEYEQSFHSPALNVSCQSILPEAKVSSSHYLDHEGVCSSLINTNDDSSLFDCLEPIMFCEESMVLKTPKSCKPPQLEVPNLSMDFWFSQPIETPYALLSTPSPFHIPL